MWNGTHMLDLLNYFAGDGEVSWMSGHLLDDPRESTDPGVQRIIHRLPEWHTGVRKRVKRK